MDLGHHKRFSHLPQEDATPANPRASRVGRGHERSHGTWAVDSAVLGDIDIVDAYSEAGRALVAIGVCVDVATGQTRSIVVLPGRPDVDVQSLALGAALDAVKSGALGGGFPAAVRLDHGIDRAPLSRVLHANGIVVETPNAALPPGCEHCERLIGRLGRRLRAAAPHPWAPQPWTDGDDVTHVGPRPLLTPETASAVMAAYMAGEE